MPFESRSSSPAGLAHVDAARWLPAREGASSTPHPALDGFNLGSYELELGEELLDLLVHLPGLGPCCALTMVAAPVRCEVAPELQSLFVLHRDDLVRERIAGFGGLAAEHLLRREMKNFAENEKEAEVEALLVALDPRQRGHADVSPISDRVQREVTAHPGVADSGPNHD
ncbi:MAG TPA: hypothetical protein VL284_20345 [Thermoanaerobaculia bacterium]|nr:hypothetical protein [Thermoanaerobaculia bacterium]